MALRDYYVVLGVTPGATPEEIRAAYREHAKALHPDRAGQESTVPFQELNEAYATLSDPARRRDYDRAAEDSGERLREVRVTTRETVHDPLSILYGDARYGSRDAIRERFWRDFTGIGVPRGERAEGLNLEVALSPEEAIRGVAVPLGVPILGVCSTCGGSGRDWGLFPCGACGAEGYVERERSVELRIPPMVRSGSLFEIPLDRMGIHNFSLRVHVLVDDRMP